MNKDKALKLFEPFENILFDYGGIFIDIHPQKTHDAFSKLGAKIDINSRLFVELEVGKITPEEFLSELKMMPAFRNTDHQQLRDAWGAMLSGIRHERVDFLRELKKTKKIYMLSNINQIHEDQLKAYLDQHPQLKDFYSLFDRVYFSHHIGLRKPNAEVFEFVCRESKLDPKKTIFIDDSLQHIEGAASMGLHTHHLSPANTFIVD